MPFSVDTSQVEDAARQLLAAGEALSDLEPVNRRAGELIQSAPAPRRSGLLASSVRADASVGGVVVGSALRYATFVHWGAPRRHVIAQPWLLNQTQTRQADLIDLYREHAQDALSQVKG